MANGLNITELNHVAVHVADLERSCDFYERVLQLSPLPRPAFDFPGAWYQLGSQQELHLIGNRQAPVVSHHRGTHFALAVASIDVVEAHLQAIGAEYQPRKLRPDGASQIFVIDPDGHWIELCQPPA